MARYTLESPVDLRGSDTASGVAVITAALMVGMARRATSEAAAPPITPSRTGGEGIVGEPVEIPMDGDRVAKG
jgi:hypothetical protein